MIKRKELRSEPILFTLHVTICLALATRGIYFLNYYFYMGSQGYCAYIIFSLAPITLLGMGAALFTSYIWYMSKCSLEALYREDHWLDQKK